MQHPKEALLRQDEMRRQAEKQIRLLVDLDIARKHPKAPLAALKGQLLASVSVPRAL
ncbi:hypothetical protein C8J32_10414 [Rhizobium sp. PP-CC-3A-592]|nr:hypothetical protein C8J32_10414 [Rhizobium sp. PP-CC-3A-592]